jgi:hypothetical protein
MMDERRILIANLNKGGVGEQACRFFGALLVSAITNAAFSRTDKERFKLDSNLQKSAKRMLTALRFLPADDELSSLSAVSNYKKFQRFYPAFRHVDD